jgi:hypothetical protein
MTTEEELTFTKAHLNDLSRVFLRHLQMDIVAEKGQKPRNRPRHKCPTKDPLACPVDQTDSVGDGLSREAKVFKPRRRKPRNKYSILGC